MDEQYPPRRARSNALFAGDPRLPTWMQPAYQMPVPEGAGPYHHDPMSGYELFSSTRPSPAEGWKFHISAYPWTAERIAGVVLPVLTAMNVWHKYLEIPKLTTRERDAVGKFIAYYPISANDAHTIAGELTSALARSGLPHLTGPAIAGEMAYGESGLLYTRYGSYQYEYVQAPGGMQSLDPARGLRPYHSAGRLRPSWITDLRQDASDTVFPRYDARRTLRGRPESSEPWTD